MQDGLLSFSLTPRLLLAYLGIVFATDSIIGNLDAVGRRPELRDHLPTRKIAARNRVINMQRHTAIHSIGPTVTVDMMVVGDDRNRQAKDAPCPQRCQSRKSQ